MDQATKLLIDGLYETHLPVADLGKSMDFYRDVIGLEFGSVIPDRKVAFFWVNGKSNAMLGLWETGSSPLRMHLHIAFRLSSQQVLDAPEYLRKRGIVPRGFNGEPVEEPVVIGWMPALSLYMRDPDGHSIEFISVLNEQPDSDFGIAPYSSWVSRP
ncbi:VOC family protein [Oryzifoliimicrobium ureilyticus]|uniref:VOC family protein n=1 Tax=Oryzifoliimicrobium ureilyticus TaxID=3113724 RepID=UPI0030766540